MCFRMSGARKRKFMYLPRRQKSLDYGLGDGTDTNGSVLPHVMPLHRLRSIDENDSTDEVERTTRNDDLDQCIGKVENSLGDQVKMAAIYDDEREIINIFTSFTRKADG